MTAHTMNRVHRNAPLSVEGRRRLVERCRTRPIAHVAAEMGISRACASKWVNRYRRYGELGLQDRSSAPIDQPSATSGAILVRIEKMRRTHKWSATRITFELHAVGVAISRRTVTRHLAALGLNRRRFIDPNGDSYREPQKIARRPGHMVHVDVKKVGRIPEGGGWRVHGKNSDHARQVARRKKKTERGGYVYLHSAVDGYSHLAYTEALPDEKAVTAIAFSIAHAPGSLQTASLGSNGSSPTTGPATAPRSSPVHCSERATSGSRHTRLDTTGKWSATTGSSPRSSSTPVNGPPKTNAQTHSESGTSITTSIGPTVPPPDNRQPPGYRPASPTSCPPTTRSMANSSGRRTRRPRDD